MRRGEILGLQWSDIDWKQARVNVRNSLVQTKAGVSLTEVKTSAGIRSVPVPKEVMRVLEEHKKNQDRERAKFGLTWKGDLVFCGEGGHRLNPRSFTKGVQRMMVRAGVPKVSFHDLRHSHATMLLELGEHPKVAQERLGHSRISVTMDTYSHVLPNIQQQAVDKISRVLAGETEEEGN